MDDAKSTKALEKTKSIKTKGNNASQESLLEKDNEQYIPLTEDNIDSYFEDDNYVQKIADLEISKKNDSTNNFKDRINPANRVQLFCFEIVNHQKFEVFMTLLIIANSILTALSDYNYVDNDNNLLNSTIRNSGQINAEPVFLFFFSLEMVMKMLAYGVMGPGNYFTDYWNLLDGFVVIIGLLSLLPNVPNLNVVRTFRCFRSMKLAAVSPALKHILNHIVLSIINLGDVLAILFLVMLFFSIVGLHLFSGPYTHTRCRLTPYPVNTSWTSGKAFAPYRCLNVDNYNLIYDQPTWTKETSPWNKPLDNCFWPIDIKQENFCSLNSLGIHQCDHSNSIPDINKRWCGSNYDARGNPRFTNSRLMRNETYIGSLSYGFANYDNLVRSFIIIFQITSLNGWSALMYQMEDSFNSSSSIFFVVVFLICNYLIVNLVLAIWNSTTVKGKALKQKKSHGPSYKYYTRHHRYLELKEKGEVPDEFKTNFDGEPWSTSTYIQIMMVHNKFCYKLIQSIYFRRFFEFSIILNASALMADYYPAPLPYLWTLEFINFIITILFVIELIIKVLALGIGRFLESKLRLMDSFVTFLCIFSSIENLPFLLYYQIDDSVTFSTEVNAFRALRIFRLLTLIRGLPNLSILVKKVLKAVRSTFAFAVIINLFIYTMALIGMTFFANHLVFDKNGYVIDSINSKEFLEAKKYMPRSNFDNFLFSFATVFQIMTTEAWNSVQNDLWRSLGMPAILFPWVVIVVGVFILLSLYVGQVIDDFANDIAQDKQEDTEKVADIDDITFENDDEIKVASIDDAEKSADVEAGLSTSSEVKASETVTRRAFFSLDCQSPRNPFYILVQYPFFDQLVLGVIILSAIALALDEPLADPNLRVSKICSQIGDASTIFFLCEAILKILGFGPTIYFSDSWNIFDFSITALSVFFLYYDDPRLNSLRSFRVFRVLRPLRLLSQFPGLRLVINSLMASVLEAGYISLLLVMVWLIFGTVAVNYKKGQLRSCSGDVYDNSIATNSSYLRLLQYPVPWNEMNYDQKSMFGPNSNAYTGNSTFTASCSGWPNTPCCLGNKFPTTGLLTSRHLCECWAGTWDFVSGANFDNIGTALIALFSIATTEGWVTLMYNVVDSNGIDMQPILNNHVEWIVAVIIFMMVGSFLAMNIFVGVVVDAYTKSYKSNNISPLDSMMTPEQQEWVRELDSRTIINDNYKEEKTSMIQKELNETYWSRLVLATIGCNTVCLAVFYFGEPSNQSLILKSLRLLFSILFIVETLHIILSKGYKVFFREFINMIDVLVILVNFAGCIKSYFVTPGSDFYVISIFRIFIAINMVMNMYPKYFSSLKCFIRTIMKTIPAFCNIGVLVLLFLFIWSLVGVNTYSKVEYYGTHNQYANFRNLNKAFITIIRFMTGEGWSQFMYDLSRVQPGCVPNPTFNTTMCGFNDSYGCIPINGCGDASVFPFFFSFVIFVSYITLNLTIAVILENYLVLANTREATINHVVKLFVAGWLSYDPSKKCYITYAELERFAVDGDCNPYCFPPDLPLSIVRQRLIGMHIRCFLGKGCYLSDVLAGFQKDYLKYHKEEMGKDPNLSVISLSESQHIKLDGGQTSNFLRTYYFHKTLAKEINVSLAVMKLKKNKKLSILKSVEVCAEFEKTFYVSRAFLVWKYGPNYNSSAIWPKSARKLNESVGFVLPYSNVIVGGIENVGGILGSWFTFSHEEVQTGSSTEEAVNSEPIASLQLSEQEPTLEPQLIKKKKVVKKKKPVDAAVPEESGDEEAATKTKKKSKKKANQEANMLEEANMEEVLPKPMTKKVMSKKK